MGSLWKWRSHKLCSLLMFAKPLILLSVQCGISGIVSFSFVTYVIAINISPISFQRLVLRRDIYSKPKQIQFVLRRGNRFLRINNKKSSKKDTYLFYTTVVMFPFWSLAFRFLPPQMSWVVNILMQEWFIIQRYPFSY